MKLISVSVLKEWVENWFTKNRFYHPYAKDNNIPIVELYDILEQMPSAQPESHWIPCSEELPEEDKNVLVSVHFMGLKQTHTNGWNDHIKPSYYVDIASHIDGEWSSASAEYKAAISRHKVIAWKPLPEPWKGEKDEHID